MLIYFFLVFFLDLRDRLVAFLPIILLDLLDAIDWISLFSIDNIRDAPRLDWSAILLVTLSKEIDF